MSDTEREPADASVTASPSESPSETAVPTSGVSRRGLLGLAGAALGGLALGGVGGAITATAVAAADTNTQYPFFGEHQSGIVTPTQDRLHFAAYDITPGTTRADLIALLEDWTAAADRLTRGLDVSETGAVGGPALAPPDDTGEAQGLPASGLTLTFGFGPGVFTDAHGNDRFGLASRRPAELVDLPTFAGDALEEASSGGDLCIQACANDPQVAVHAIRNLSRIAFGRASIRWSQLGFGRTSSTSKAQVTERNLFGFKDGTANITAEETDVVNKDVWVGGNSWLAGGSILVARKIRMIIETWDRTSLDEQEHVMGRTKGTGSPLSGGDEFTPVRFNHAGPDGRKLAMDSHVALAHPDHNHGARLLRRGYNYVDGNDQLGRLNAGLFFLAFQADPRTAFIPIQKQLGHSDLLNEYIRHVGSAIFAVPPGAKPGEHIGAGIFG
ncbi:deferrochelatase/peroxidase EfeB [Mycetocola sp. BIGb0189]|uniref:iron uptake transporter deferrochelatase/peroxidase subunit n=1 Tax=Mycetocola sp. BIGb0189 TaxID=2940604 RepID=UPI0037CC5CD2|nr:deferrochelatase/peroxidase EfeB [Mycetocola sp. BIGb0189]